MLSNRKDEGSNNSYPQNEHHIDDTILTIPPLVLDQQRRLFRQQPRALYFSIFIWISITGGRFLAPFLEDAGSMTATTIGGLLALQKGTSVLASSPCAIFADWVEAKHPGLGRKYVLGGGVLLGTICFWSNACHRFCPTIGIFQSLAWFSLLRILHAIAVSLIFPVLDGICVDYLKRNGTPNDYGKERLYGAISWAMTNLVIGPALDHYQDFAFLYPAAIVATVLVFLTLQWYDPPLDQHAAKHDDGIVSTYNTNNNNSHRVKRRISDLHLDDIDDEHSDSNDNEHQKYMISPTTSTTRTATTTQNGGFLHTCIQCGTNWYSVTFLMALITLAAGQAIVNDLVFLFFEELGSTFTLMSLTVVMTVAFEIPIFHVAPKLTDMLTSSGLVFLASASYVIRVLGYTFVPTGRSWWVLLLEPLHGVTYACSQTATVDFATKLIPESGKEATGQGLLQFFTGVGSVLGLLLGGWMDDVYGPRWMYRVSAIIVSIGSCIFGGALLGGVRWSSSSSSSCRDRQSSNYHVIRQDLQTQQHEVGDEDVHGVEGGTVEMMDQNMQSIHKTGLD
jgi:MFS family permease